MLVWSLQAVPIRISVTHDSRWHLTCACFALKFTALAENSCCRLTRKMAIKMVCIESVSCAKYNISESVWLVVVRDTFCSYGVMELCTRGLGTSISTLRARGVNLSSVRILCVIAEERPRIQLTMSFAKLFSALGLSPRAVSTSFGCRVSIGICLQVIVVVVVLVVAVAVFSQPYWTIPCGVSFMCKLTADKNHR